MPAFAVPAPSRRGDELGDPWLDEARESLTYWEERERRLPRLAVRKRREAREMAHRWRARVAEAERELYGRGIVGALLQLAAERRLPAPSQHAARVAARRAVQATAMLLVALVVMIAAGAALAVEVLASLLEAVG